MFDRPLPPTPVLQTERLILRPPELRDIPAVQREFPHWEIVRYLRAEIPWPYPDDGAETNMREGIEKMTAREVLSWVITLKGGDDEATGRIELKPDVEGRDMRGFWLARALWGRGLITEAAERVTRFAFEDLDWPFLYLTNAAANLASHRVKEKQGAVIVDREPFNYREGPGERVIWRLDRDVWRQRRASQPAGG